MICIRREKSFLDQAQGKLPTHQSISNTMITKRMGVWGQTKRNTCAEKQASIMS